MYVQRSKEIHEMIEELRPSIIFIDVFLSTDFIVLYSISKKYSIKICFIRTALSPYYIKINNITSAPLFSSSTDYAQIVKEWNMFFMNRMIAHFIEKIKYLGKNDLSLIKRKMVTLNIPNNYSIDMKKSFHVGFNNVPELVLSPFISEYNNFKHRDRQFYVNLKIKENRSELSNKEFNLHKKYFLEQKSIGNKIIFCSFGTIIKASDFSYKLINMLIEIANKELNYLFIISFSQEIELKNNTNNNVFIYNKIPQLEILKMSNLFITHGGLNSIKESIHFNVPLIACPTEFIWDQNNNARLVERLGIGIKVNIETIDTTQLINYINDALNNDSYHKKLEYIIAQISTSLNEQETLQFIENIPILY